MTQHTMVTFRLHRIGVILIVIGVMLFAILIFAGGYIAGRVEGKKITLKSPLPAPRGEGGQRPGEGPPPAKPTQPTETFTIRAGSYANEADAKAVVARLAARKLDATIESRTTSEGTNFFVVFAGKFNSRDEASKMAATLAEEERLDTAVVPSSNL